MAQLLHSNLIQTSPNRGGYSIPLSDDASNKKPEWNTLENQKNVKKVKFYYPFIRIYPTNCYAWFQGFSELESVEGLVQLNTNKVKSMAYMFDGCTKLTSLDMSNFVISWTVTNMEQMFANCSSVETLDLSHFLTENVTNMRAMFAGCSKLKSLDLFDLYG